MVAVTAAAVSVERLFPLSLHPLNGGGQVEIQHLVLADHVAEQLLTVLALELVAARTAHRLVLTQLGDHLIAEMFHGQMVHSLPRLVLGTRLKAAQLTETRHPLLLPTAR